MKDPTYSINCHTDKLTLEEAGQQQAIKGNFADTRVRGAADKAVIRCVLEL